MFDRLRTLNYDRLTKVYVALALMGAAVLSPLHLSTGPLVLLAGFAFFRFRRQRPVVALTVDLFIFWALPLMYEVIVSPWAAWLPALPVLVLLSGDMERLSSSHRFAMGTARWKPGNVLIGLGTVSSVGIAVCGLLGAMSGLVAGGILMACLVGLVLRIRLGMPSQSVAVVPLRYRVVADEHLDFSVPIESGFRLGGWFSPLAEQGWVAVEPGRMKLGDSVAELHVSLRPHLSGPSTVELTGLLLDRWGLLQYQFELRVAELEVIPRARYAAWLARRYLETSGAGAVTPVAGVLVPSKATVGARRGIDFYGNRLYQQGDSPKAIDWKRSMKYQEMVVKEYEDPQVSAAVLVVNLTASNVEEADRLAYAFITTAITLSAEGIPAIVAAYNHERRVAVTNLLDPQRLVVTALELSQEIVMREAPERYFESPDPLRLRANINRLRRQESEAIGKLTGLLEMEFKALQALAARNPATAAINEALRRAGRATSVVFVSAMNHDQEAVRMAKYNLRLQNQAFTEVSLDGRSNGRRRAGKGREGFGFRSII